jgi:hypothetical protein
VIVVLSKLRRQGPDSGLLYRGGGCCGGRGSGGCGGGFLAQIQKLRSCLLHHAMNGCKGVKVEVHSPATLSIVTGRLVPVD